VHRAFGIGLLVTVGCSDDPEVFVPREGVPDVILISMDGVRLDRTHFGGNAHVTTPSLDAIMDESLWFPLAWSQSNESLLSHASLFGGRYVSEIAYPDYRTFVLPDAFEPDIQFNSVAELMTLAGYQSAAFIGGGHIRAEFGLGQGFSPYQETSDFGSFQASLPPALTWLDSQSTDTPIFMFFHGYDAHRPYGHASVFYLPFDSDYEGPMKKLVMTRNATEQIYRGRHYSKFERVVIRHETGGQMSDPVQTYASLEEIASDPDKGRQLSQADLNHLVARYDSGVLAVDTYVGMLIDALKDSGRWEQTLLIITSDHGEDLQDHGFTNHRAVLFDSTTRVPFILSGGALPESWRGQQSEALVDAVDLMPTLSDVAEIESPVGTRGRSLWPLLQGEELQPKAVVYQEGVTGQTSVRSATHRLVFEPKDGLLTDGDYQRRMESDVLFGGSFQLYQSSNDPWEREDILVDQVEVAISLRESMVEIAKTMKVGTARHTPSPEADWEMQKQDYWESPAEASSSD
jgi:arylsulfatase A-like enzyme